MFKFLKEGLKKAINSIAGAVKKKDEGEVAEEKKSVEEVKYEKKKKEAKEKETEVKERVEELAEDIKKKERKEKEVVKEKREITEEARLELEGDREEERAEAEEGIRKEEKEKGFFGKIFGKLTEKVAEKITTVHLTEAEFERSFWELERVMLKNNVAIQVIEKIRADLKEDLVDSPVKRGKTEEIILSSLQGSIEKLFVNSFELNSELKKKKPYVIVFFGVNGSGKTTTIAKLAHMLKQEKLSSVIAAGDTFRAASIEQLEEHGKKLGIRVIKHKYGADSAAVAFDAIKHAQAHGIDIVLIDTAGRMHSNVNLMEEMKKITRVTKPDLRIFVGESLIGNDAVEQAREFQEKVGIDAIILTKADVDERGGAALSISYVTGKPIIFLGVGQKYSDLEKFDRYEMVRRVCG